MFIDLKYGKNGLFLLSLSGLSQLESRKPYFYVIAKKNDQVKRKLLSSLPADYIVIEETGFLPVVWNGHKYDLAYDYSVFKVMADSPTEIPQLAHQFAEAGFSISGFNIKYVVRMAWDYDIRFFDTEPIYYALDPSIIDKLSKLKITIFDLEVKDSKPYLISIYDYQPFGEVRKDDIQHYFLPRDQYEVIARLNQATILGGHNIISFDIPWLKKNGLLVNTENKLLVDTSQILASWSASLQTGAARSLLDVAKTMQRQLNIPQEEIEIKEKYKGKVEKMSDEELVKYNVNDIALTARIISPIFTFVAILSAMTQIPFSTLTQLTAGTVAEYYFFRSLEHRGLIPEYRKVEWEASAEKVFIKMEQYLAKNIGKFDIKMMYPTFVMKNFVDPTLMVQDPGSKYGVRFDYNSGIGLFWSEIVKLARLRQLTRKLKKSDPKFENVDNGIKAILNSLAYGVQGKKSGYGPLANPITPKIIFLETANILFTVINSLAEKGISVVYGDTDSIFVENVQDIKKVHEMVQEEFGRYGFEVDIEGFYELGYFLKKKNYILLGEDFLIKGGTFKMKSKFYLPQIVAKNMLKLLAMDISQRRKYIKELIESASTEELFSSISQQLWRTLGKDLVSAKHAIKEGKEVAIVRTPWEELPRMYLKKIQLYHLAMPTNAPLSAFLIQESTKDTITLAEYSPFLIIEALALYVPIEARSVAGSLGLNYSGGERLLFYYGDKIYRFMPKDFKYILSSKINPVLEVPANAVNSSLNYSKLIGIKADYIMKPVDITRDVLERVVYAIVINHLNTLGIV